MTHEDKYAEHVQRYLRCKAWFDKAIDERNEALDELRSWKMVATQRHRVSTTYVVGFCCFVSGLLFGAIVEGFFR